MYFSLTFLSISIVPEESTIYVTTFSGVTSGGIVISGITC